MILLPNRLTVRSLSASLILFLLSLGVAAPGASARPKIVDFEYDYPTGSIVIINSERKLYYILGKGRALRYGVAVGEEEEIWTGMEIVTLKRDAPRWVDPEDEENVIEPGPGNPLGLRAMNLGWSLWRIHGTPQRWSIGQAVSNGCIRMRNEDVVDLFPRVHIGAPVYAIKSRAYAKIKPRHRGIKYVDIEDEDEYDKKYRRGREDDEDEDE